MPWIYLSPHFDDVALSCGGLLWEQAQAGEQVSIWTVCAGKPAARKLSPLALKLHARWDVGANAPTQRKREDQESCRILGVGKRYFSIPDCIYRCNLQTGKYMYVSEAALNGPIHPGDALILHTLQELLRQSLPSHSTVVSPLGLGAHVDHRLTRLAVEGLDLPTWYYADFPYVVRYQSQVEQMEQDGWEKQVFRISDNGLSAWVDSISSHGSQVSTFWTSAAEMKQAITGYLQWSGGICLWKKPA